MDIELKRKIESLHGCQVKLVKQIKLFLNDVKQDCLMMGNLIVEDFLDEQEEQQLATDDGFVRVRVIEPCLNVSEELCLRKWTNSYVLNKGWKSIVENNELKEKDIIEVWSFRVKRQLGVAIVKKDLVELKRKNELLHGSQIKFVKQIKLFHNDVKEDSLKIENPIEEDFLDEQEEQQLATNDGFIRVRVIEPGLSDSRELCLRKWTNSYVLKKGWKSIVENSKLKEGDEIELWSFRVKGKLGFTVLKFEQW